jgi:hypothetical protein
MVRAAEEAYRKPTASAYQAANNTLSVAGRFATKFTNLLF